MSPIGWQTVAGGGMGCEGEWGGVIKFFIIKAMRNYNSDIYEVNLQNLDIVLPEDPLIGLQVFEISSNF